MTKLLFVCSHNQWRSPTAESLFANSPDYQARSAGTEPGARIKITPGMIGWADVIFVMEKKHVRRIEDRFAEDITGKRLICLNIPDDYRYQDEQLIALLRSAIGAHIPLPD